MSTVTTVKCDICHEIIEREEGGKGLVFRSMKSGDFRFGLLRETQGRHLCWDCARTLKQELAAIDI